MLFRSTLITNGALESGTIKWDMNEPLDGLKTIVIPSRSLPVVMSKIDRKIFPDFEMEWYYSIKSSLDRLAKEEQFDVLLSTSPPESAHVIAAELKAISGAKWIADLRDLWAYDHYRRYGGVHRKILTIMEKNVLGKADIITTVSETWTKFLSRTYPGKVMFVPNSFDPDWFGGDNVLSGEKFRITYLGKLDPYSQDIRQLFAALKKCMEDGTIPSNSVEVDFYIGGYRKPDISAIAKEYGLSDTVKEHSTVSLQNSINIMKNSSVLLLVGWKGISQEGWYSQKVFEYLGAANPVLLINGSGNVELSSFIKNTGCGVAAESVEDMKTALIKFYNDFKTGNRLVPGREREKYSCPSVIGGLADIIDKL